MLTSWAATLGCVAAFTALPVDARILGDDVYDSQAQAIVDGFSIAEVLGQMTQITITQVLNSDYSLNEDSVRTYAKLHVGSYLNTPTENHKHRPVYYSTHTDLMWTNWIAAASLAATTTLSSIPGVVANDDAYDAKAQAIVDGFSTAQVIGQMTQVDISTVMNKDNTLNEDYVRAYAQQYVGSYLNTIWDEPLGENTFQVDSLDLVNVAQCNGEALFAAAYSAAVTAILSLPGTVSATSAATAAAEDMVLDAKAQSIVDGFSVAQVIGQMTQIDISTVINPKDNTLNEDWVRLYAQQYVGSYLNTIWDEPKGKNLRTQDLFRMPIPAQF
ncbi:hypothetical protein GQ600_13419 [Phytophthora cactorum]|nr:hypothetical protein GQ600_13419 [Phytophthora cactorum]